MGSPYATEHLKLQISKSKMADSGHLKQSNNRYWRWVDIIFSILIWYRYNICKISRYWYRYL